MITVKELKDWLNQPHHHDEQFVAVDDGGLTLEIKSEKNAHNQSDDADDYYELGGWPDPPQENPRQKGDDDGVEYADPRDFMDGVE